MPQLALGGCTPIERNESVASVRIVVAMISGRSTITTVITFGSTSEKTSRKPEAPWAIAASTYSFSETDSTWPRTGRYT